MKKHILPLALITLGTAAISHAQVSYSNVNDVYYQDFYKADGWGSSNSNITWTNNSTVPGWYAGLLGYASATTTFTYTDSTTIRQSTGSISTPGTSLFMFREAANLTEGALGSVAFDTYVPGANNGGIFYAVQITNNTGSAITSFSFGYTGEQWNVNSNSNPQSLTVAYSTSATSIYGTGTWTAAPSATFTSPITTGSYFGSGNLPTQRTSVGATVTDVNIAAGDSVWIRWFDVNNALNDHGLAVDDFYFTVAGTPSAVPEPSTWAAIFGVSALALAVARRARRNRA